MIELPKLNFDDRGLIPAIVQDYRDGKVLMLAYMNKESLELTLKTGRTHFYSRKRNLLWAKGETSGHIQMVRSIYYDCDEDALLVIVDQVGNACHTGERSCFHREIENYSFRETQQEPVEHYMLVFLELYKLLLERKATLPANSYTAKLFEEGLDRILKKIGEEATEVVIASKNGSDKEIAYEMADLWFHCLMTLAYHGIEPQEVLRELCRRRGRSKLSDTQPS
jgi:phosphoribosyl-ATP pyrophosphohydrolase/phosphoribosyl-AMP cyclohydrolase